VGLDLPLVLRLEKFQRLLKVQTKLFCCFSFLYVDVFTMILFGAALTIEKNTHTLDWN
jgi:hypothetical protein